MSRKPRTDSKLKTLPPQAQAQLFEMLRAMPYRKAVELVHEHFGVATSIGALSEFFSWYPLSRQLEQSAEFAEKIEEALKTNPALQLDASKISAVAQVAFEAHALETQNSDLYIELAKLRIKREEGEREERRIKILEAKAAKADEAAKVESDETLTEEEKAKRMRQIFRMG